MHKNMTDCERKCLEMDFQKFVQRHFESPSNCRNLAQIRFYVNELCAKIHEYEHTYQFVPAHAYALLAQYNHAQNRLILVDFKTTYSAVA
ncbi:MAG TPA: hypothetical protein DCE81_07865 [Cytophagales bacterium]|jgi:hypothetical protein|nr:hypothetical protein [Cytophagales bacterium]